MAGRTDVCGEAATADGSMGQWQARQWPSGKLAPGGGRVAAYRPRPSEFHRSQESDRRQFDPEREATSHTSFRFHHDFGVHGREEAASDR